MYQLIDLGNAFVAGLMLAAFADEYNKNKPFGWSLSLFILNALFALNII
jgi:hypothetical protein